MDKRSVKTFDLLFDMLSIQEPKLLKHKETCYTLFRTCQKWYASEGNQGVKRMKSILNFLVAKALGEKQPEALDFTKSTGGVPNLVIPLMEFCNISGRDTKAARRLAIVLSFVRFVDLFAGQPKDYDVNLQLDVINSNLSPEVDSIIYGTGKYQDAGYQKFLDQFCLKYKDHPVVQKFHAALSLSGLASPGIYIRHTKGPNGPLLENSHLDLIALHQHGSLIDDIYNLQAEILKEEKFSFSPSSELRRDYVLPDYNLVVKPTSVGKITLLPEKAGKVRLIAQPDYYTQKTLKPIHDYLANVLKSFERDYTFDQVSSHEVIRQWTEKGGYISSFDHSSCTDLFPFKFQLEIIRKFKSETLVESYHNVMVKREYDLKLPSGKTRKVSWKSGQPMGALSSWPLMAVSHHLLVHYAYWRSHGFILPKTMFSKYCILGDDIVINDKTTAECYLTLVRDMGMKVNLSKSHISEGEETLAEFAKVIVWKGHVIHIVKPAQLRAAINDWRLAVPVLLSYKSNKFFVAKIATVTRLIAKYFARGSKVLTYLLSVPSFLGGLDFRHGNYQSLVGIHAGPLNPIFCYIALKQSSIIRRQNEKARSICEASNMNPEIRKYLREHGKYLKYLEPYYVHKDVDINSAILSGLMETNQTLPYFEKDEMESPPWFDHSEDLKENISLWKKALAVSSRFYLQFDESMNWWRIKVAGDERTIHWMDEYSFQKIGSYILMKDLESRAK